MHSVKLENFAREYPDRNFPWFRALERAEARALVVKLAAKLGSVADGRVIVQEVLQRSRRLANFNADDDGFDPKRVFELVSIEPTDRVFINWYHFDEIDEMNVEDLNAHFSDIWYPTVDDIDIVDETLSWVVSIGHESDVRVLTIT